MLESGHFVSVLLFYGHYLYDTKCSCASAVFFSHKLYTEYLVSTNIPPGNSVFNIYLRSEHDCLL